MYVHTQATSGKTAVIYQGGNEIKRIDLSKVEKPYEFDINCSEGANTVRVEQGRICVVSSDCPDKICVNQGYIENSLFPIVCLPHKLSISIEKSDNNDFDAVAGGN